jgi:hypothetical protein
MNTSEDRLPVVVGRRLGAALAFVAVLLLADRGLDLVLRQGLRRYYGLDRPAAVLCVGHSRTVLGIDASMLEAALGVPVAKYALDGVNPTDRAAMVRYFLRHQPGVKLVLYDVESTLFASSRLSENTYRLFLPFMYDPEVVEYVRDRCPSLLEFMGFRQLHATRYDESSVNRAVRGWLGFDENLKYGQLDVDLLVSRIERGQTRPVVVDEESHLAFAALMEELSVAGVDVLLWHPPTVDVLDNVDRNRREKVRERFRQIADKHDTVEYVSYVGSFRERYDIFYDAIHVNARGKKLITESLASDIKRLGLLAPLR